MAMARTVRAVDDEEAMAAGAAPGSAEDFGSVVVRRT